MLKRAIHAAKLAITRPGVAYLRGLDILDSLSHSAVARTLRIDEKALRKIENEFDTSVLTDLERAFRTNSDDTPYNSLRELYCLTRLTGARTVVETGVAGGFSSAAFLTALEANGDGCLHSIELPNRLRVGWAIPARLKSIWDLRLGSSEELLGYLLEELGSIDIFMHDSNHTYETMMFEFETAWPKIASAGLLISDDIHWNSAFFDFCRAVHRRPTFLDPKRSAVIRK